MGDIDSLGSTNTDFLLEEARAWTGVSAIPEFSSELVHGPLNRGDHGILQGKAS